MEDGPLKIAMARFSQYLILLIAALPLLAQPFRPPAVPLVTHNPYFSVWSMGETLYSDHTKHWTGTPQPLHSMVRIDGQAFRLMGQTPRPNWRVTVQPEPLPQKSVQVLPTRTIYEFEGSGVGVTLSFITPALPEDLDLLSRPATYLVWDVRSIDGAEHEVELYFDASTVLTVDHANQKVGWGRYKLGGLQVLRAGSLEQNILLKEGDNVRIDWGNLYVVAAPGEGVNQAIAEQYVAHDSFTGTGAAPTSDILEAEFAARYHHPSLAVSFSLGKVGSATVSRHLAIAYDNLFGVEYFHRRLRPYWRRNGTTAADMLRAAMAEYESLAARCVRFDEKLMADLTRVGGEKYAQISALAYRQTHAAHELSADADGTPLLFSKENFSNGSIATVDVTYPSAPLYLLLNTRLARALIEPIYQYASMDRWKFPFAPHDIGTYPRANGQTYGGGETSEERQMPVEESGNMLILTAAAAVADSDTAFAEKYWPVIQQWARYLKVKGLDPENQLCTDDFAGHLAHNANLSIKAIMGLASYSKLCDMTGRTEEARTYRELAQSFATEWQRLAADGDHYVLAFGNPGTWSQKYNLVWDQLLGFEIFPQDVAAKEIAYYQTVQNEFGLPLDNRSQYTKLDWIIWTATLAESDNDFRALTDPVYKFLNETPDRVPMTDWYWTHDARRRGFQARSVVGGVFIKILSDRTLWEKWLARSAN
jgi:glutaminase A-like protein/uncharacterized protein DUF5127/uncharacterized protein DUF4964